VKGAETRLASRQHGLVTTAQLLAAGWSNDVIAARVRSGWLRRRHRGVYLVGPLETPYTQAMAAVLAAGPRAVLSHYPAAVLWVLCPPLAGPMHVTLPAGAHARPGIVVHRAALHPADITRRHGIPVTSAARTILDLAASAPDVERALNEALVQRLVTTRSLNEQFSRYPRHRGTGALKRATQTEPKLTRSEAEHRAFDLIRRAGLPEPETNVRIEGYEVDLVWRTQRLVVEIDGYAFHSSRRSFERDRRKDQTLLAAGFRTMRITWSQLEEEVAVVAAITRALAERR